MRFINLQCRNWKTNEPAKFEIAGDGSYIRNIDVFDNGRQIREKAYIDNRKEDYLVGSILEDVSVKTQTPTDQLTDLQKKIAEKTGCVFYGDYVVFKISYYYTEKKECFTAGEFFTELSKHYQGEENRLEEFLS